MFRLRKSKPSSRKETTGGRRMPMTYYRSGGNANTASPFEKRPAKSKSAINKAGRALLNIALIALIILGLIYSLIVRPSARLIINSQTYHPEGVYRAVATDRLRSLSNRSKISFNEQTV